MQPQQTRGEFQEVLVLTGSRGP